MLHVSLKRLIYNSHMKRETLTLPLSDIKLNDSNPRQITAQQMKRLVKSIQDFPEMTELRPIVVDENNVILGGNMRYRAMQQLGYEQTEVIKVSGLTDEQKREFIIKDNVPFGEWDWDELANGWDAEELNDWGLDIPEAEAVGQEVEEVDVPEVAGEPDSEAGKVYSLGRHRLVCGDCTKADIMSKLMGGEVADMLLADPPYGVDYHGRTKDRLTIANDKVDSQDELREFLCDSLSVADQFIKNGGVYYIFSPPQAENMRTFIEAIMSKHRIRNTLIWVKNAMVMGWGDYRNRHELIFYGWKEGAHYWCGSRSQDTILDKEIDYDSMSKADAVAMLKEILEDNALPATVLKFAKPVANREHPTMKPIALLSYLIKNSSRSGEIVLDPFGGSGSTLLACEQTGRLCYTAELDRHYCDVIRKRYWKFVNNGNEDGWQDGTK